MQCSSWLLVQNIWQYWIYNKYTFQVHFSSAQMTQTAALTSVQETDASRFVIKINCLRLICQIVIAEVSWIQFIIIILFTRHFLFTYVFLSLPVTLLTNFVIFHLFVSYSTPVLFLDKRINFYHNFYQSIRMV